MQENTGGDLVPEARGLRVSRKRGSLGERPGRRRSLSCVHRSSRSWGRLQGPGPGAGVTEHTAPQWVDAPASDAEGAVKASAASRGCFVTGSFCHVCSDGTVMDLGHK